jgi:glucose-1-phosphate cytidylyltransferase
VKVIILAGGMGTRIAEETADKPKPMVLIGDRPILWHLMNIYATQGFTEFVIAGGYRFDVLTNWVKDLQSPWNVEVIDTGLETQTGGRIKICMELLPGESVFATYGDGLANVDLKALLEFHKRNERLATVTAVRPPARFGYLQIEDDEVRHFGEKNQSDEGWINGGFFVLEPEVANFIHQMSEPFEIGALPRLVEKKELMAFEHRGFWQPMDTLREKHDLENCSKLTPPPWLNFT